MLARGTRHQRLTTPREPDGPKLSTPAALAPTTAALVRARGPALRRGRLLDVGFDPAAASAGPTTRITDPGRASASSRRALLMPEAQVLGVEIAPELHVHDCVEIKFRTPHAVTRVFPVIAFVGVEFSPDHQSHAGRRREGSGRRAESQPPVPGFSGRRRVLDM